MANYKGIENWLMIAFITRNSNLVPLLEGLCSSNPCRFDFSGFLGFCRNRTTTSSFTDPPWQTELFLNRLGWLIRESRVVENAYQWCAYLRLSFFLSWVANTLITVLSGWRRDEHPMNHVGPKKLSGAVADLVYGQPATIELVKTIHNVCGLACIPESG